MDRFRPRTKAVRKYSKMDGQIERKIGERVELDMDRAKKNFLLDSIKLHHPLPTPQPRTLSPPDR